MIIPFNHHRRRKALVDVGCGMVEMDFRTPDRIAITAAASNPPRAGSVQLLVEITLVYSIKTGSHELLCEQGPMITAVGGSKLDRTIWMPIAEAIISAALAQFSSDPRLPSLARIAALETKRANIQDTERELSDRLSVARSEGAEIDAELAARRRAISACAT